MEVCYGMCEVELGLVVAVIIVPESVAAVSPASVRHVAYAVRPASGDVMGHVVYYGTMVDGVVYLVVRTTTEVVTAAMAHAAHLVVTTATHLGVSSAAHL